MNRFFWSLILICTVGWPVLAQQKVIRRAPVKPVFSYDLGASVGSYNGDSYTELNLGLNWHLNSFTTWRNALYSRFGSKESSTSGLDSSLRFDYDYASQGGGFGYNIFAGPGYRFSKQEQSAVFVEAGLTLRSGGLSLGGGVKTLTYSDPGTNADGSSRSKQDTIVFIILGGGGSF